MADPLSGRTLFGYVDDLAGQIGPRPPGGAGDAAARALIYQRLLEAGISPGWIEELTFSTWDTWGWTLLAPVFATLLGSVCGELAPRRLRRVGKLAGAGLGLLSVFHLWQSGQAKQDVFAPFYPHRPSGSLLVRIPPSGEVLRRAMLVGHIDTNKVRSTFQPMVKGMIRGIMAPGILFPCLAGVAQLIEAVAGESKIGRAARQAGRAGTLGAAAMLPVVLNDERHGFVPGANDNAGAVACLLGIGAFLRAAPLQHTEVWLAFSGAEEIGHLGLKQILDFYGSDLRQATCIDFELVGTGRIIYVTRSDHFSLPVSYAPDLHSLALAQETARRHPELRVTGRPVTITDEVATLRNRGYRAIGLVGIGPDGWPANWHQATDVVENIEPDSLETAAKFALAMLETLDSGFPA